MKRPRTDTAFSKMEPLEGRTFFTVASGFIQSDFTSTLSSPTAMEFAPDGRLFVCQQDGDLRVFADGALLPDPALSLDVNSAGERGLLGIAFDPGFAANGNIYVYYTSPTPVIHNRVSRFHLTGNVVDAGSEQVLLDLPPLSNATNHNGGAIHFGPDGKLYVAVGENANPPNAQSLQTTLGKILRLNPDGTIPGDNPFVAQTSGQNQAIFALGLRNPYTFAFDPADGRMFINDVGQSTSEEIDIGQAGANYGWPQIEGHRTSQESPAGYIDPLFTYPHQGGRFSGAAITGGAFYRADPAASARFPDAFAGRYFFADFGAGFVKAIDPATQVVTDFASALNGPVDLDVGPDGALYALEYGGGRVTRFAADGAAVPLADLVPEIAAEPIAADVVQGDKDRVTVRLKNVGTQRLTGKATVTLTLVPADGSSVAPVEPLRVVRTSVQLNAGQAKSVRLRYRYPAIAGAYRLAVQAVPDAGQADATNDTAMSTTPVLISPPTVDLSPAFSQPLPEQLRSGRRNSLTFEIANGGNVTFDGRVTLRIRASSDGVASDDDVTLRTVRPRIRVTAEKPRTVRIHFVPPASLPAGSYFLVADVDFDGLVVESEEANNIATSAAAVPLV